MAFDWVKNLRGSLSEDQCNEEDVKGANSFALFWNMVRTIAPEEVVEDFENFLRTSGISRMDARGNLPHNPETGRGDYRIDLPNGLSFTFHGAELAPPAGICARNYARCVLYHFVHHGLLMSFMGLLGIRNPSLTHTQSPGQQVGRLILQLARSIMVATSSWLLTASDSKRQQTLF